MVEKNQLSFGHGKVLMTLDSPEEIERLAGRIAEQALSVRQTEEAVTRLLQPRPPAEEKVRLVDPNVKDAERGCKVRLACASHQRPQGPGKILIEYTSLEDFDRILEVLGRSKEVLRP